MASKTITASPRFAEGVTLSAWPAGNLTGEGVSGTAVASGTVSSGQVSFSGLTAGARYAAGVSAAGPFITFTADPDASLLSSSPSTRWVNGDSYVSQVVYAGPAAALNDASATLKAQGGGRISLGGVSYTLEDSLILRSGVHFWGTGINGDVFSGSDAQLPFLGTVLRAKNGLNKDLVVTENFSTLTGQANPSAYSVPARWGLHHLVLDGNKANNTAGVPLRIFAKAYEVDHVVIQNGAAGGVYSEYGSGGYEMEAHWTCFRITDNAGDGLEWRGPHDSQFSQGVVARNDTHVGVKLPRGAWIGGEQFNNVHVWGSHSIQWLIGTTNAFFTNCTSDGGGIVLTGSGNTWIGTIYGTNTPGQFAVKLGDGTAVTVGQNTVEGRVYNFKGSPFVVYAPNLTTTGSRFRVTASMGGMRRYEANGGIAKLTSAAAGGATTLNVDDTSFLPASGTLYGSDGTNDATAITYTSKTPTSLAGVGGLPGAGLASGAALWNATAPASADSLEVWDYDNTFAAGVLLERSTPLAQGSHNATKTFTGKTQILEGVMPGTGSIYSGSGAPTRPSNRDPSAGDFYFRTDTTGTANQRLYVCTVGGASPTWVGIL